MSDGWRRLRRGGLDCSGWSAPGGCCRLHEGGDELLGFGLQPLVFGWVVCWHGMRESRGCVYMIDVGRGWMDVKMKGGETVRHFPAIAHHL